MARTIARPRRWRSGARTWRRAGAIGAFGAAELPGSRFLTICNAGRLATTGIGTALAPVYAKAEAGEAVEVFACETRPLRQGARLTAWELADAGVPVTVLPDGAAGALLASGRVDAVITGCDRVAANGDVANKIGTFGLAIAARHHGVPFYVLGPRSTLDVATPSGDAIEIEQRAASELAVAPGASVWNPAFDVTPGLAGDRADHRRGRAARAVRAGDRRRRIWRRGREAPSFRHDRSQVHHPGRPRADPVDHRADQRMLLGARARRRRTPSAPAAGRARAARSPAAA